MDNTINNDIIEKVTIKSVAIYKAIGMLPPIETKDLWEEKNSIEHQKNYENKNVSEINDTMNDTKMPSMPKDWKDITDPKLKKKLRQKVYNKAYREANKDKIKLQGKAHYEANKDKYKLQNKDWRESNKDKHRLYKKNWREANKEKIRKQSRERYKTDIQHKLACRLRNRINKSIKLGSAVRDLGCSIDEFKTYLESKFQKGMTWDNWTTDGWHIDHIKPLASFDLTDRKQMLEACHYTNLQPLWWQDNLTKGDS